MAPRTNPRSTASRDNAASSPTKPSKRVNKARSPTKPMSRTMRSASRELGEPETVVRPKRTKRSRAVREGSEESVVSAASVEVKDGRRRKKARAPVAVAADLSMVAEEQEQVNEAEMNLAKNTQSPGAMSNLSGTTALTSQSDQKMADLDTGMIVELLPDLAREAFQLLELLVPLKASPDFVETVIRELQVPGSGRGKRLRLRERTFDSTKENYGGELLIDPALILRKLFGDSELATEDFRPDVIVHAANIAAFIKDLLVAQRDHPNTMYLLQRVDDVFPTPFLSGFEEDPKLGSSALLEPTFRLALDLRTQTSIAIFKVYRDEMNFDPDELLAALFYEPPSQRNESLTPYEDLVRNGQSRKMGGVGAEALPLSGGQIFDYQADEILKRVESIREAFNVEGNGTIDYVDFDKLHEKFPWINFLTNIVQWCQLRLDEINKNIEKQGGIDNITSLLVEKVKSSDSQVELYYHQPAKASQPPPDITKDKVGLLPAATIIPASAGKSLYNSPHSLIALMRKAPPESSAPPSNQQHPAAPLHRSAEPQTQNSKRAESKLQPISEKFANIMDDEIRDEDDGVSDNSERSIQEVLSLHYEGETYNHKENQPILPQRDLKSERPRFVDRQPNAQRVSWTQEIEDSDVEANTAHTGKRRYQDVEDDIEEDEPAFQTDSRAVDESRRVKAVSPIVQPRNQSQRVQPSPKRQRTQYVGEAEEGVVATTVRQHGEGRLEESHDEPEGSQDQHLDATQEEGPIQLTPRHELLQSRAHALDDVPPSSYPFVHETARVVMARYRIVQGAPQQRQKWSVAETEALINMIDRYGCKWSAILKEGRDYFLETRDQVSLKDKARNIKVELLIAGATLPKNFNGVALGKKEKEKVKANRMNPYRLEGEPIGGESYDMDGNFIGED